MTTMAVVDVQRDQTVRAFNDAFQRSLEADDHYSANGRLPEIAAIDAERSAHLESAIADPDAFAKPPRYVSHALYDTLLTHYQTGPIFLEVSHDGVRLFPPELRAKLAKTPGISYSRRCFIYEAALDAAVKWAHSVTRGGASIPRGCALAIRNMISSHTRTAASGGLLSAFGEEEARERIEAVLKLADESGVVRIAIITTDDPWMTVGQVPALCVSKLESASLMQVMPDASLFCFPAAMGNRLHCPVGKLDPKLGWEHYVNRFGKTAAVRTRLADRPNTVFFRGTPMASFREYIISKSTAANADSSKNFQFDTKLLPIGISSNFVHYPSVADRVKIGLDLTGGGDWSIRSRELALIRCVGLRLVPVNITLSMPSSSPESPPPPPRVTNVSDHKSFVNLLIRDGIDNHIIRFPRYTLSGKITVGKHLKTPADITEAQRDSVERMQTIANDALFYEIQNAVTRIIDPARLAEEQRRVDIAYDRVVSLTTPRMLQFLYNAMVRLVTASLPFSNEELEAPVRKQMRLAATILRENNSDRPSSRTPPPPPVSPPRRRRSQTPRQKSPPPPRRSPSPPTVTPPSR